MGEQSSDDAYDGFQPEVDALDRFERVIDTQIETLRGIDDKAAHVTQLVGMLLGIVLTGVTLAWRIEGIRIGSVPLLSKGAFVVGLLFLFAALITGIVTYLGNRYQYGIHRTVLRGLGQYHVSTPEYVDLIRGGYVIAIKRNRIIVKINVYQFEWLLSFLLLGLLYLGVGTAILLTSLDITGRILVLLATVAASVAVVRYVPREKFLVSLGGNFDYV